MVWCGGRDLSPTHPQPQHHCPVQLSRAEFEQLAADLGHFETFGDLLLRWQQVQTSWERLCNTEPTHPTVRAFAAARLDYKYSGYALLSLCLPAGCWWGVVGCQPFFDRQKNPTLFFVTGLGASLVATDWSLCGTDNVTYGVYVRSHTHTHTHTRRQSFRCVVPM